MKKTFLNLIISLTVAILMGCNTNIVKEPPKITITIGDKVLEYKTVLINRNGKNYDKDASMTIVKDYNNVPVIEIGNTAEIFFKSNPPDELKVYDILIDEYGKQIYTDKEIINVPVILYDGRYAFQIEKHLASLLSSKYEPDKKDIREFKIIASWGENECEYSFVIKTKCNLLRFSATYPLGY